MKWRPSCPFHVRAPLPERPELSLLLPERRTHSSDLWVRAQGLCEEGGGEAGLTDALGNPIMSVFTELLSLIIRQHADGKGTHVAGRAERVWKIFIPGRPVLSSHGFIEWKPRA